MKSIQVQTSFPLAFVIAAASLCGGCSSTEADVDGGTPDVDAAPTDRGVVRDAGGADAASSVDAQAGFSAYAPPPAEVAASAACAAFCTAVDTACGKPTCDPLAECKVRSGQCAASTEAFLQCQADKGSFSCGPDGWTVVHDCNKDTSVCPANGILDATCEGNCGGRTLAGCGCDDMCEEARDCCFDYHLCKGRKAAFHVPETCAETNEEKGCCGWLLGSSYPYTDVLYRCSGGQVVAERCPDGQTCLTDGNGHAVCADSIDSFAATCFP